MKRLFIILGLIVALALANQCQRLNYLPMPKSIKCNDESKEPHVLEDPCKLLYHVVNPNEDQLDHFKELIQDQQKKTFKCKITNLIFGPM